jgi:hypothetical protein
MAQKIEFNKTFVFTISNFSFGPLPRSELVALFKDGRISSHFLERCLEQWFPELTFVNKTGYDHVDRKGVKYDAKNFTKGGLSFMPSNQMGAGRSFNAPVAHAHAKEINYIACDIVDFPKVRIRFATGKQLVEDYPQARIPFSKRGEFFDR